MARSLISFVFTSNYVNLTEETMARILFVEDDPISLRKGVELLRTFGHEAVPARNGQQAAQLIRAALPDAILLDVELPDTNGFDFGRKLQQHPRTKAIPLGFITSRDAPGDIKTGFSSGGRVYLTKPYSSLGLSTVLKSLLGDKAGS